MLQIRYTGVTRALLSVFAILMASLTAIAQTTTEKPALQVVPATPLSGTFILKQGTEVRLRYEEEVTSKTARTGNSVNLILIEDLQVGDVVVVRAGAKAVGTVAKAKKSGMLGKGGELDIQLDFLQAGDNKIKLRGAKDEKGQGRRAMLGLAALGPVGLAVAGATHGQNASVNPGARIMAYVGEDTPLPSVAQ